jgi:hypothetical protein
MNESVERLKSVHLQNERTIWIRAPRDRASVEHLTVFLDGELYREPPATRKIAHRPAAVATGRFFMQTSRKFHHAFIEAMHDGPKRC